MLNLEKMQTTASRNPRFRFVLLGIAAFLILLAATRPVSLGDTSDYAKEVAENLGLSPFANGSTLWEFGHLLWRPLGWALATALSPVLSGLGWTPFMQASFALTAISVVGSVITVALWYLLLADLGRSSKMALLIALSLACGHGFLLYAHSGCAYIPGLTSLTASVYLLRKGKPVVAALFYALATLIWMPYILTGLALVLMAMAPRDWNERVRDSLPRIRLAPAIRFTAIAMAAILAGYCLGGMAKKIGSFSEAKAWYAGASHGFPPSFKGVQVITGLPRASFYLAKDGIVLKRYLRHDPYAPVGLTDLLRASVWKLGAFYLFAICLIRELCRRSVSAWPLLLLLAAFGPVLFFAVFLFEPGMPERFLPVLPFLVLAIGCIFADFEVRRRLSQTGIAVFLAAVAVSNCYSFAAPRVDSEDKAAWSRVASLRSRLTTASVVVVTTNQDDLEAYLSRSLFGAVNRPQAFRLYDIVEPGSLRMLHWREEFAAEVIRTWKDGGDVWLSKRVRSAKPRPEWNWVERGDPREIWGDLAGFLRTIETDEDLDGGDGFARLARNDANLKFLAPFGEAYMQASLAPSVR